MDDSTLSGRVIRIDSGSCQVDTEVGELRCTLRKRLGRGKRDLVRLIAVGDRVDVSRDGEQGVIEQIQPRRTQLSRRAMSHRGREQVVAANVDLLIAMTSFAEPAPLFELLDHSLVAASIGGMEAIVCINKLDLAPPDPFAHDLGVYEDIGYPVVRVSALTGAGLDDLREQMTQRTAVVAGPSGVGKSSVLNALQPGLALRTSTVSGKSGEGRHTTTHSALLRLDFGSYVIDTPGVRDYTIWHRDAGELDRHLPEFAPYLAGCRFANCTHSHEPDCRVKAALEEGAIDPRRHASYLNMLAEAQADPFGRRDG